MLVRERAGLKTTTISGLHKQVHILLLSNTCGNTFRGEGKIHYYNINGVGEGSVCSTYNL